MKQIKTLVCLSLVVLFFIPISGFSLILGISFPFFGKKDESEIDTRFNAKTNVSYSAGTDSNWSYGNQRKEFPSNEACYVRIGSTIIAEKRKNVGTEIQVTYRFTASPRCSIELSDGIAQQNETTDDNVIEYTRTIKAEKEKKAQEEIMIFRYFPFENSESVVLEVLYDEHIIEKADVRSTIYFYK